MSSSLNCSSPIPSWDNFFYYRVLNKGKLFKLVLLIVSVSQLTIYSLNFVLLLLSSQSVISDSLQPHELQYARLPCPSPSPRACSNSCLWNQWCHPTISSSVVPFSCLQSFPESGSFLMSWFFASDGQSIGTSALASVLLMNFVKSVLY